MADAAAPGLQSPAGLLAPAPGRLIVAILCGIAILVAMPPVILGFPTATYASAHDAVVALRWLAHFADQFWQGELYPRWLVGANQGLGEPSFYFYPPLAYWIGALLRGPGWLAPDTALALALMVGWVGAVLACFAWLRGHVPPWPAALGAIFYIISPYTLTVDVYIRTAFAETMALAFPPLILLGIDGCLRQARRAPHILVAATAGLAITHLPLLLLTGYCAGIYLLALGWRAPRRVILAGLCMVIGVLAAAVTFVPALMLQQHVHMEVMYQDHFNIDRWFLDSPLIWWRQKHLFGCLLLPTIIAAVVMPIVWPTAASRAGSAFAVVLALAATTLLLQFSPSKPIWSIIPLIAKVQFPWRLMGLFALLTALLFAMGLAWASPARRRMAAGLAFALALAPNLWALVDLRYVRGPAREAENARAIGIEQYVSRSWTGPVDLGRISATAPAPMLEPAEAGRVGKATWSAGQLVLALEVTRPARLVLPQQNFPGWRARDQGGTDLPVHAAPPWGLVAVAVPPGTSQVRLDRPMLPQEWWGLAASLAGLVGWLLLAAFEHRRRLS